MNDKQFNLSKSVILSFEVEISGNNEEVLTPRFIIKSDNFDLQLHCVLVDNTVNVKIPVLTSVLEPKSYPIVLEFVSGNNIYIGYESSIEFISPTSVQVIPKAEEVPVSRINIMSSSIKEEEAIITNTPSNLSIDPPPLNTKIETQTPLFRVKATASGLLDRINKKRDK